MRNVSISDPITPIHHNIWLKGKKKKRYTKTTKLTSIHLLDHGDGSHGQGEGEHHKERRDSTRWHPLEAKNSTNGLKNGIDGGILKHNLRQVQ